jgi:anaphase-promoting complex subunit 8
MFLFFAVTVMLDLHSATEHMLETVEELQANYPTSVHLMAQRALVLYHMRGELANSPAQAIDYDPG